MNPNYKLLKSYWFLAALFLLLLNDLYLKEAIGNWLTGKLSDFSGLFVFAVFWASLFPKKKMIILWSTAFLFTFWKSGYSEGVIHFWNSLEVMTVQRVVDYTDLTALAVLPCVLHFTSPKRTWKTVPITPALPLALSLFAFMATSKPKNQIDLTRSYNIEATSEQIIKLMTNTSIYYEGFGSTLLESRELNYLRVEFEGKKCLYMTLIIELSPLENQSTQIKLLQAKSYCPDDKAKKAAIDNFESIVLKYINEHIGK